MPFFEELEVGETRELGEREVTKAEIIEFAERYDPQPFHTGEAADADSTFDGLMASGWHTAAICMRLIADSSDGRGLEIGMGIDDLRWHRPLRPGDTLSVSVEVIEKRPSENRPSSGVVRKSIIGTNQRGEEVISYESTVLHERADT